jgi:prepilin-type processing-associated H-X9-DG protein/prepilin-type N-terminal cleavage/methylation domain-containing protein
LVGERGQNISNRGRPGILMKNNQSSAFTLVELLTVIAVVALLAGLTATLLPRAKLAAHRAASAGNLRQLGQAVTAFSADHQGRLPGRVTSSDKWPRLLMPYLQDDVKVLAEPGDPNSFLRTGRDPLNNKRNQTSYILNGFNDVGAFSDESVVVTFYGVEQPTRTILMSGQSGTGHFYMDFAEGNQNEVLNKASYGNGANYLFADGSVRFLRVEDYDDTLWLVGKSNPIPDVR